jgi:hypothetical protein
MLMAVSSKDALEQITDVSHAWSNLRAGKSFGGLPLETFLGEIKPSYDVRAEIAAAEVQLQSLRARRVTVDEASLKIVQRIVNAVKADPDEGDDGELYVAMGYVRRRDRDKGLTRRKREQKPAEAHSLDGEAKEGAAP